MRAKQCERVSEHALLAAGHRRRREPEVRKQSGVVQRLAKRRPEGVRFAERDPAVQAATQTTLRDGVQLYDPRVIRFWLTHPWLLLHGVRYAIWQRLHPDAPWLCPGTIEFLEAHLPKDMTVFEFGSGRSTAWLAARVRSIISIEHDARWYRATRRRLDERGLRADLRLIPLNHAAAEPERHRYDMPPDYVRAIEHQTAGSLDLVVIDGHYRTHVIAARFRRLRAADGCSSTTCSSGLTLLCCRSLATGRESTTAPTG